MEKLLPPVVYPCDLELYTKKFEFEDEEFDFQKYFEEICHPDDRDQFPNPRDTLLKYLKQVRESFGFDVDCVPPYGFFPIKFTPHDIENTEEENKAMYNNAANFVINEINSLANDKFYELVELKKVVATHCRVMLLTFTVKEKDAAAADMETIQAIVLVNGLNSFVLRHEHWRFKPTDDEAAAAQVAAFLLSL